MNRFRIGIDVGGTFTDLYLIDEANRRIARHKLPSTPGQPYLAPLAGIREILEQGGGTGAAVAFVGLGTTVMTNALLERKGAVTGLITTAGFRDLLEIARQTRPHTFDPFVSKPDPLVPRQLRVEVTERVAADGSVLTPLDRASVDAAIASLMAAGVQAVAVCFLNAYANPQHEQAVARTLRERWPQGDVSVSSSVLPEFREYERLSSTIVNAYLMPIAREYLERFESEVGRLGVPQPPFIMNSGGGIMTAAQAAERPIDTLFSGPSGGVSGALHVAARAGYRNIITFDMGGTSTDVCVAQDGKPQLSHTRVINGVPLKAAALDVHTVGAGGSSIAAIDAGGMLRVGPHSAGARPGPACYALGGEQATVTDANVVLGRLNPEYLLGGALKIDASRAFAAIDTRVARPRDLKTVDAAAAMVAIADANMAHAVRFVSVERGLDPADFVLVAFGGAGPLHAASVARQLGVAGVLVPDAPGVLCAMGVLVKDLQMDFGRTRIVSEGTPGCSAAVDDTYRELEGRARAAFEGAQKPLALSRTADVRYVGQNHELTVDVPAGTIDDGALANIRMNFHDAHREMFGYASEEKRLQLVTFRVQARLPVERHELADTKSAARTGAPQAAATRRVYFEESNALRVPVRAEPVEARTASGHGYVECPVYERSALQSGDTIAGPAIVEQMDATTVIPPDFTARVDAFSNLFLTRTS